MPKILLKSSFSQEHLYALKQEFPFFDFTEQCSEEHDWMSVEVIYGAHITPNELSLAPRLQWIHTPTNETDQLPLTEIQERGNIILSIGAKKSVTQTAEFALASILQFAKQLHLWPKASHSPKEFWDWPLRDTMWSLDGKLLLQIGMGKVGNEITRLASAIGIHCWGVSNKLSFHPYCKKKFVLSEMHSLLPNADIVVVAYPLLGAKKPVIKKEELALIKRDSILIVVDQSEAIDLSALEEIAKKTHWRGVVLDALSHPLPQTSPLWNIPNFIITPNIASFPPEPDDYSFSLFRKNLRTYVARKYSEMRNLITEVEK
jgi:phosphoglycerate dehydrogenase-like enzyme